MLDQEYNYQYINLIRKIMDGPEEMNHRTGTVVRALPNQSIGYKITKKLPMINSRRMFPRTAMAELAWTLSGKKDLSWLQKYTKMWDSFANAANEIEASYGYRWKYAFDRDQIHSMFNALVADPSDRQCVVMAWDNSKDGLGNRWTSNVPCPIGFVVNIINNEVNMNVILRSSDAIVGLPYDMLMYSLLLIALTHELQEAGLEVTYGRIDLTLAHVHIYAPHFEIARNLVASTYAYQLNKQENDMYGIQDLCLNNHHWKKIRLINLESSPDLIMDMFESLITLQTIGQKKPPIMKPEVIK